MTPFQWRITILLKSKCWEILPDLLLDWYELSVIDIEELWVIGCYECGERKRERRWMLFLNFPIYAVSSTFPVWYNFICIILLLLFHNTKMTNAIIIRGRCSPAWYSRIQKSALRLRECEPVNPLCIWQEWWSLFHAKNQEWGAEKATRGK